MPQTPKGERPDLEQYPDREPTPEEREVGIDDVDVQAKAILDDARERAAIHPEDPSIERRQSEDTVDMTNVDVDVSANGAPKP